MDDKVKKIHKESIVIDALGYVTRPDLLEEFIDELLETGLTALHLSVVGTDAGPSESIKQIEEWLRYIERRSDKLILIQDTLDIEKAHEEEKLGIIMGSQNGTIIGNDLNFLEIFKRLGMRIIEPCYTWQNLLGEGCGERTDSGLSTFGVDAVKEMNRLGIAIDLSHCGDRVTMDAIKYSKYPVICTHSNPRAMVDHLRNKTDEQIMAIAKTNGVMGMVTYAPLVVKDTRPTWANFLDITDYAVKLVGANHVGIGTDFNIWANREEHTAWCKANPNLIPQGPDLGWTWRTIHVNDDGRVDYKQLFKFTEGLLDRGYSEEDIKKILGLSFLRVFKEIWGK